MSALGKTLTRSAGKVAKTAVRDRRGGGASGGPGDLTVEDVEGEGEGETDDDVDVYGLQNEIDVPDEVEIPKTGGSRRKKRAARQRTKQREDQRKINLAYLRQKAPEEVRHALGALASSTGEPARVQDPTLPPAPGRPVRMALLAGLQAIRRGRIWADWIRRVQENVLRAMQRARARRASGSEPSFRCAGTTPSG